MASVLEKTQKSIVDSSFRDIYFQMKPPLISTKTYNDLSVSIAFQTLLFLANEHVNIA
jgi:hypothetical protein